MPTSMFENANLAASTKTGNLLAGDVNEFIPFDASVEVFAVASAANVNLSVFADSDLLVDDKEIINIGATLNDKDHLIDTFLVAEGTRLAAFLRETGAVATTDVLTKFVITPIE